MRRADPPEPLSRLYCPDPEFHPAERLAAVMPRVMRGWDRTPGSCPVCGPDAGTTRCRYGYGVYTLCAGCGVGLGERGGEWDRALSDARQARWKLVWRREV
ncbi:hypothetical protein WKI68_36060 [Streptomyces sp. MS1.HAVA.3]|uniref:Uncharacterized protein n=1 Tax=Streptomyces caledonius TaxID=3134107 RepID=A0ABU8UCY6_9ACTN